MTKTTANTGFASGGVTCKFVALCFYSGAVLIESFALRNPPERKAQKRYIYVSSTYLTARISHFPGKNIVAL
jgi:hypothetical protein